MTDTLAPLAHRLRLWADVAPFGEMREAMIEEADHIEQVEADLAEALHLMQESVTLPYYPYWVRKVRAFLDAHPRQP